MKQLIGYCRVSTSEQGQSRNGLEVQRMEIERFAHDHGYQVIDIVEEVSSGKNDDTRRPVLSDALARVRSLRCALVVAKLDRFSRSMAYVATSMETFKRQGVSFYSVELGVDTDPFLLHLYASLAEKERMLIGQRTKAALARVKARGVLLGNRTNRQEASSKGASAMRTIAKDYADSVRHIIQPMLDQGMTQGAISDRLNQYGTPTQRGGKWSMTQLRRILSYY